MKKRNLKATFGILAAVTVGGLLTPMSVQAETAGEWREENGQLYWYEDGVKQGYKENDLNYRGKEIYDPISDAWYWLDNVQGGAKTVNKDVYQESEAGAWGDRVGEDGKRYGKWVRYDANGHMIKGWDETENGTYYFDETYGTMAKGYATIGTKEYYFNEASGVLEFEVGEVPENGWKNIDGSDYWYEGYVRQGYSIDEAYRGKEIFDEATNAWYWLDNVDYGKKAENKDVYQDSYAGDWGDYVGTDGRRYGKWVRYDENGQMKKGWDEVNGDKYYFDLETGAMVKGTATIDGIECTFDKETGIYQKPLSEQRGYKIGDKVSGTASRGELITITYLGNDEWLGSDGDIWYAYLHRDGTMHWTTGIRG